jgi:hypothetical protein
LLTMKTTLSRLLAARAPLPARLAAVFVLSLLWMASPARASDRWATLEAIHQLENPTDTTAPGPYGELGAYQFREGTWKTYTNTPFRRALDRRTSDAIAVKHYNHIKAELVDHGVNPTAYRIALAWNGGLGAALESRPPSAAVDYATRASNLAAEFGKAALADAR